MTRTFFHAQLPTSRGNRDINVELNTQYRRCNASGALSILSSASKLNLGMYDKSSKMCVELPRMGGAARIALGNSQISQINHSKYFTRFDAAGCVLQFVFGKTKGALLS